MQAGVEHEELSPIQRAERDLLGIVLRDNGEVSGELRQVLASADFSDPRHAAVYSAAAILWDAGRGATPGLVAKQLEARGQKAALALLGGKDGLIAFMQAAPAARNWQALVRTIREDRVGRDAAQAMAAALARLKAGESAEDVVERVRRELADLEVEAATGGPERLSAIVRRHMSTVSDDQAAGRKPGVPTGMEEWDRVMGTLKPEREYVIAARPGVGKTSLAMSWMLGAARAGHPQLIFSLEMSKAELAERAMADASSVPAHTISNRFVSREQWGEIYGAFPKLAPLAIDVDDRRLTWPQIKAQARIWRAQHRDTMPVIWVDYLGLVRSMRNVPRREQIAEMTADAKGLAKELKIPWVFLAQLNRESEKREDRRPQLSDLRDAGEIEQDADCVIFPFRPQMGTTLSEGVEHEDAELIVAKHRGGPMGSVPCAYWPKFTRFADRPGLPEEPTQQTLPTTEERTS